MAMTEAAYEIIKGPQNAAFLLTCDHASNHVPEWVSGGDLGVGAADMSRHIAYDLGAAGVTRHLAELLGAPAVLSRFSRLVIDPNRGEDDPTLVMQLYDGTMIPANRAISPADRLERLDRLYRPYHAAIDAEACALSQPPIYVAIHSFTPQLAGRPKRPWHVTVLCADDTRYSAPLLQEMAKDQSLCIAENEPYVGDLRGDSVETHALSRGLMNALIEIRNDLIVTDAQQRAWAERLAPMLHAARLVAQAK